jgi:DNA-binding transcriptional ArsR family regulator
MKDDSEKPKQNELFSVETTWFHVFNAMVHSGELAKISGSTVKVYLVVKAHTGFATGSSFPSLETIAQLSGVTSRQVMRALSELEEKGYIRKEKKGRSNIYTLREKVPFMDDAGETTHVATWDYIPGTVKHTVAELKNVAISGDFAGAKLVHIDTLTINIANQGGTIVNINAGDASGEAKEKSRKIREHALKSAKDILGTVQDNLSGTPPEDD